MKWKNVVYGLLVLSGLAILASSTYGLKDIADTVLSKIGLSNPCEKTITYSIDGFDKRFGLSREEFLAEVVKAEKVWEEPSNKNLFEYKEDGDLKINLIYDYRQEATDKLKSIGLVINNNKATYDSLKTRYESLLSSYKLKKSVLESEVAGINADRATYEKQVAYWNSRKGAPKAEYEKLQETQTSINERIRNASNMQNELNSMADTINYLTTTINGLIEKLNLNVQKYNSTTETTGEEFYDGEFVRDKYGQRINIYQFDSKTRLQRVIAHEMGHALGLEHVNDEDAIMYKLNQGDSEKPTKSDITELDRVCHLKI